LLSFYSKNLYRDVGQTWRGTGFLYLFLLLALAWIPHSLKVHTGFNEWLNENAPAFLLQVPPISIRNGRVHTPVDTPYIITTNTGDPLIIIDLTGQYTSLDDTTAVILLTEDKLYLKNEQRRRTEIHDLSQVQEFSFDRTDLERWAVWAHTWVGVSFYFLVLLSEFVYRILQALLYAAVGLAFCKSLKVELPYLTVLRLTCIAVTPIVLVQTILSYASVNVPGLSLFSLAAALGYLYFAVKANSEIEPAPA
jgi:hypothetical protein